MNNILKQFGIKTDAEINQIYHSAWKIGDEYILKKINNLESFKSSVLLSDLLLQDGLPVVEYINPFCNDEYCLMKQIHGTHLNAYDGDVITNGYMLGQIIVQLHISLKKIDDKIECYSSFYYEEMKS